MTSLNNLAYFLSYFVTAVVLLAVFLLIYTRITRHDEWALWILDTNDGVKNRNRDGSEVSQPLQCTGDVRGKVARNRVS